MSDKKIIQPYTQANLESVNTTMLRKEMRKRGISQLNVKKAEMISSLLSLLVRFIIIHKQRSQWNSIKITNSNNNYWYQ